MTMVRMTIDGRQVEVPSGASILEAARTAGIYVPVLCHHPDLPPAGGSLAARVVFQGERRIENAGPEKRGKGCGLCVVEVQGETELLESCTTEAKSGMVVHTNTKRVRAKRQENLLPILARHRHACLTCAQQEGCSLTQCSSNVPENERCCTLFGQCELQRVVKEVGILPATPRWVPTNLPPLQTQPLFLRDYGLCIGCTRCVRACRDLRGVEAIGFVFDENGLIQVGSLAPTLEDSGCIFCTACVEVCPTGALRDKSVRPGKKKEDLVPCKSACPAQIDVPGYLRLIAEGKREEANAVIREKVPLPGVLGRVCVRPCEDVCWRREVNEPIAICALKRYAADGDRGLWKKKAKPARETGKKVAVVGSGPAGLTVAYYLRKKGHQVTVFEAKSQAGGRMRYGIPRYRLPREVLDKELEDIFDLGIEFKPNQALGIQVTLERLKAQGFEAVFLGVGAELSRRLELEGADGADVLWGVEFLSKVAEGEKLSLKERVLVVGGGTVAVDVALTARRCGAKEVTLVCLEEREEMPARSWEVEGALAEGVKLLTSWGPHRILRDKGCLTGVELAHCVCVRDEGNRINPRFDGIRQHLQADQVIFAVGQVCDLSILRDSPAIDVSTGRIGVDQATLETGMKGVYAGGDATAGSGSIIHAVAAGRKAACSIDRALGGTGDIEEVLFEKGSPLPHVGRREGFAFWPREKPREIAPGQRQGGFLEVVLGFSDEQAVREATRCLQCDLRLSIGGNPAPSDPLLPFHKDKLERIPEGGGVYRLYDGERKVRFIKGTANLRQDLRRAMEEGAKAVWFDFEESQLYSQRENELIRAYVQEHGHMPGGEGDDEDLF